MPAASMTVKIIEEARVAVPVTAAASLPPPEPVTLSALDAQWLTIPLIQRVLIFVVPDADDNTTTTTTTPPFAFASAVTALRSSLAETLARFPTLAGRIVHRPATGDAAFDCAAASAGGGVRFLVADANGVDAARLAGDEEHDAAAFAALVPALETGALPAETFAAQVTRLRGGGVAVGVAMHHAAVDGRSVWRFLRAWAAACRGEGEADAAADETTRTTFDRAVVGVPGGQELVRSVLRRCAPDLPVVPVAAHMIRPNLSRRTFTIAAQAIHRLKHRIASLSLSLSPAQNAGTPTPPPSSFVAIAAAAWVSFVRAKHAAGTISSASDEEVYLFFFADIRARLDPPPGPGYFGTCITGCLARAAAGDLLLGERGLGVAAAAVAGEVRRAAEDPLAGWNWMENFAQGQVDTDRLVNLAGDTRFRAYEVADFGWGQPARTELVTMNHDGQVVLVAAKGGDGGGVQASVSLHPEHMGAFKSHFLSYFE